MTVVESPKAVPAVPLKVGVASFVELPSAGVARVTTGATSIVHVWLAPALSLPTPATLIHIVRDGIVPLEHEAQPWMPAYKGALTAGQTADLVVYLRTLSGKPPWSEVEREVKRIEGESR